MTLRRRINLRRVVHISRLPAHVLFEILNKMSNKELVRMRRTCNYVNSVAKKNENQLASRPALGSSITFLCFSKELCFSTPDYFNYGMPSASELDFEKSMAGISFSKIHVNIRSYNRDAFVEVLKLFNRIRPICHKFKMLQCPLDLIVPITDCLTFQIDFNTSYLRGYINDYRTLKGALNVLSTLRKARNCSKFTIWVPEYTELTEGVYDKVKDFFRIAFNTDARGFEELLWDIHKSEKRITMKSMSISFQEHYSVFDPRKLPPFLKILKPIGCSEYEYEPVPAAVYLMMLKSQCVFIFENISYKRQEIYITVKTAEAMEERIMSIYRHPADDTKDDVYDDEYEYYEDENDEHEEDEEVVDSHQRHVVLKRNVRAIVKSLLEE